jgi:hypothetical protein
MRRLAAAGALLLAAGLAGAALAGEPAAGATEASAPDANLFVYRDTASPAACEAELYLDGRQFAALPQHSYTSLAVGPGIHELEFRWASACGHGDVTDQLTIADRRLYYFALTGDTHVTHDLLSPSYSTNLHETTTLTPVDPDEGVQAVAACCRFMAAHVRF